MPAQLGVGLDAPYGSAQFHRLYYDD